MEISRVNSKEKIGYLKVIVGAMFAGKTTFLINEFNSIKTCRPCLLFKPELDTRYSQKEIVSHNQEKVKAFVIRNISDIESHLLSHNFKDIFIDELHFFSPDSYVYLEELAKRGIKVVASGLD